MKIYLDNNLGVTKVEQEELTQDTYGYNILKVYIPNAVLTPYDTFTCYYGALLQNGRKVGWFAMEARTSTDADYEKNYTLYKATLEQCVVSVEGKVYIGCQVLLGNSGNATLIKKNTAVVQFNVRKSVAINNDILVLDSDQTNTDVLESYKNLLENALTTYATKATTYTKTEVNSALALKADKSTTYTKTEVNSALALKADKAEVYTKQESDNKFAPKTTDYVKHDGNQLKDNEGNNIYPNLADGSVSAEKTNFMEFYGTNVLDNSTVSSNKIWKRQYGNPSTIFQTDNTDGFCFQPIELKKNIDYYLTPCRFSNTLILIGTWDSETTAYTGTYYTIENCPFAICTAGSTAGFGTAKIIPTSDCILFFSSTTLLDIGQPRTAMVFKGDELPSEFVPYGQYLNLIIPQLETPLKFNKTLIVSKNNNFGGYSSIREAIDNANDGDTIIVYPDEYYESVVCIDKTIHIKGLDKTSCILYYDSNTYQTMPLSIASGSVENLTIYAKKQDGATSTNMPYAVHIDFNYSYGKSLHFDNCIFKNDWQASVGIGLKGGFNLSFKNCDFISYANTTNGALFFHDNVESGYYGTSNIKLDTCNIWCDGDIAIMPSSFGNTDNTTNMTFYRTLIYSTNNGHTNASVGVGRPVTGDGWRQYNNFFLTNDSFGNSNNLFNHS